MTTEESEWNRKEHKVFVEEYKGIIRLLDVAVVLMVIFSFGALFLTNYTITESGYRTGEQVIVKEANPTAAELLGYEEPTPQLKSKFNGFIIQIIYWSFYLSLYILTRVRLRKEWVLYALIIFVTFYFTAHTADFFNNLGYGLPKIMRGMWGWI